MDAGDGRLLPLRTVRTPRFISCAAPGGAPRCALLPSSCDAAGGEVYTPPDRDGGGGPALCPSAASVGVGRCRSSLDDKRCGVTEDACGYRGRFYEPHDPECTLVADGSDGAEAGWTVRDGGPSAGTAVRTTFASCNGHSPGAEGVYECVLDSSACGDGEKFDYTKWTEEWGDHPCNCEDVRVGLCRDGPLADDEEWTEENSHCAVSPADCGEGRTFVNAREAAGSGRNRRECRLCGPGGSPPAPPFEAGACLRPGSGGAEPGDYARCALGRSECADDAGEAFVPAPGLRLRGLRCPVERTSNWGKCAGSGDRVECTNAADSCLYAFRFERSAESAGDGGCDVHGSRASGIPTYFPYCAPRTDNDERDWRDVRCVWDKAECDGETERWEEARPGNLSWFRGCTCEDVLTGACVGPGIDGGFHCAASRDGCADPSAYVPQRLLADSGVDPGACRLCRSRPGGAPPKPAFEAKGATVRTRRPAAPGPAGAPARPAEGEVPALPTPTLAYAPPSASPPGAGGLPPGAVWGVAAGGLAGAALAALLVALVTGRSREGDLPARVFVGEAGDTPEDGRAGESRFHDAEETASIVSIN